MITEISKGCLCLWWLQGEGYGQQVEGVTGFYFSSLD